MRFIIVMLLASVPVLATCTSPCVRENNVSFGSGTSGTITLSAVGAGDQLIIGGGSAAAAAVISSITSSGVTCAWVNIIQTAVVRDAEIWSCPNSTGTVSTATFTINFIGTLGVTFNVNISEYSGMPATITQEGVAAGTHNTSGNPTTATLTVAATNAILLYSVCRSGGTFVSVPAGWTALGTPAAGYQFIYQYVASAASSYQGVYSYLSSAAWETEIAGFFISGAPSGSVRHRVIN